MDSPDDLSPLSPVFYAFQTEPSQKTPFHLQTFLRPTSKGQLKRPTYSKYAGRSRKLSNDDFDLKRRTEPDQASEHKGILASSLRGQNSKNFHFSPEKGVYANRKQKTPQKILKKSDGSTEPPLHQKRTSFAENQPKTLLRSNTLTEDRQMQSKASNREKSPEPKSLVNLKAGVTEKVHTEEDDSDIFSPGPESRTSSRQTTLMSIHTNALRKRLLERNTQVTGTIALSNMIRRKNCHCSDCGGLSKFEKRHLNVVTMTKREEMRVEKNLRAGHKHTLADLDRKFFERKSESKSAKSSEKNSRVLMKFKPKFDAILNGVRDKVKVKFLNLESLNINKEKYSHSHATMTDFKDHSMSHLEHSAGIKNRPLASERLHDPSKVSLNLIEESQKETGPSKEIHSARTNTSKKHLDKLSSMKLSLTETGAKKSPNKVFIQKVQQSQVSLQKFIKKEEKKLVKRIDKRNTSPSKSQPLAAQVLSKVNEVTLARRLQVTNPEESSALKRNVNSKSREKLVIDTYASNKNRKLVDDKRPTVFSATLPTKRMISVESLPRLDLGFMPNKESAGTPRTEISSLHTKHFIARNRLTLHSDRISGVLGGDDSTSRIIKTDRDLFSIGDHSTKFSDYLGIKMSTEPNEDSFRKSRNVVKINTERDLKSVYKQQAKAYLTERLQNPKIRYISPNVRLIA